MGEERARKAKKTEDVIYGCFLATKHLPLSYLCLSPSYNKQVVNTCFKFLFLKLTIVKLNPICHYINESKTHY